MAKKRKRKAAKDVAPEHELPGGFWRQVFAVLMIAVAIILVMTWFGSGGSLLNNIHKGAYFAIGIATYVIPVLLVYLSVKIFRSEDNRIPIVMWIASVLMMVWLAGVFGLPTIGKPEPTGGVVGEWLNSLVTQILAPGVAAFIYIVLIFITAIFILQVSPAAVFRGLLNMLRTGRKAEDADNARMMRKAAKAPEAEEIDLKISGAPEPGMEKLKVSKGKPAPVPAKEPERAMLAVSDPNWKMPPIDLLEKKNSPGEPGNAQQNAFIIKSTLAEFGIEVEMEGANIGPRVTQYTMKPPSGVNLSKIVSRDKELALNLAVDKIRIEAPIPGTRLVGVEIPNV